MEDTRERARSARLAVLTSGAPVFAALLAAALFGAATPLSKALLRALPPAQLAGLLYLGAAAGLLPAVVSHARRNRPVGRRSVVMLAGAIVFGGVIGPLLLLLGLQQVSAVSVSLWLNMELVATAVLGQLFFREHLGRLGWVGVGGVVLAGTILAGAEAGSGATAAVLVTLACGCWGLAPASEDAPG